MAQSRARRRAHAWTVAGVAALSAMSAASAALLTSAVSTRRTLAAQAAGASADPEMGTSQGLAVDRAARISRLRYDIALSVPADRRTPLAGRETITFNLAGTSASLPVDFD